MKNKEPVFEWLLGDDNPPVKYLTLTNILGKSQTSKEVRGARSQLMEYDPTLIILDHFEEFIHETNRYRRYWKIH
ncbi:MAG: hypothetical protein MI975_16710 [Cytophagales bacterium]|nr:hypothetical protein [Cytophagales bacterium]